MTRASLQTAGGAGGIAVIVLGGAGADAIVADVFRPGTGGKLPTQDDQLSLGHLIDGQAVIDEAIVCRRGGDLEINIHGGPRVVRAALELLARRGADASANAAQALPQAHRDFNNPAIGHELLEVLPLAQSTLVAAVIARQWSAGLSKLCCDALAQLERSAAPDPALAKRLSDAAAGLTLVRRLLDGPEVVLVGPPNVGKSSLTNTLVGRDVSLVCDQPGTTRDWVRELALLKGVPVWLTDTAGIWEQAIGVDAQAVARARQCAAEADLVLLLGHDDQPPEWLCGTPLLRVWPQCDLHPPQLGHPPSPAGPLPISTLTGQGIDALQQAVLTALGLASIDASQPRAFTHRQQDLLNLAGQAVARGSADVAGALLCEVLGRE